MSDEQNKEQSGAAQPGAQSGPHPGAQSGARSSSHSGSQTATVIKKYANRRLYNTSTSTYVTLEDLAQMVRGGQDFVVYDAKTGEEITRSVLTQIIFEEENKGSQNLLPVNFLRQLIRFYGDAMQGVVPSYLDMSIESLMKEQDKIRQQMTDAVSGGLGGPLGGALGGGALGGDAMRGAFSGDAMKVMEDMTRRNMVMFQEAMRAFNPFATARTGMGKMGEPPSKPQAASPASPQTDKRADHRNDDLQQLRKQMSEMQDKLNAMTKPE